MRGRPVGIGNCAAQVFIAAILFSAIRADGMPRVGACREWTKSGSADDRRGIESVRTGAVQFRRPTRVAAVDVVLSPAWRRHHYTESKNV